MIILLLFALTFSSCSSGAPQHTALHGQGAPVCGVRYYRADHEPRDDARAGLQHAGAHRVPIVGTVESPEGAQDQAWLLGAQLPDLAEGAQFHGETGAS